MFDRARVGRRLGLLLALVALSWVPAAQGQDLGTLRLGVLAFGTVNWELDVIQHHGLDQAAGFTLEVQGYAGGNATNVALMGAAVDAVVDDWLWVSRQRADGTPLVFAVPYSSSVGALMVPPDAGLDGLADLAGKTIGVAGGPIDKSWLLIRAVAERQAGLDLAAESEQVFGAPPLLTETFRAGDLDAVINYWHYAARLEAEGYRRLMGVAQAQAALGAAPDTPQLGYVFREAWVQEHPRLVEAFARASRDAKEIMASSDDEWQRLRPLTKAADEATLGMLKKRYREGIVEHWGDEERADAAKLYGVLAEIGGEELVGSSPVLVEGTFYDGVRY